MTEEATISKNNSVSTSSLNEEIIKRDVNHIHTEIRQLRNQQYLLTTAGLTVFGVISAWYFQKELPPYSRFIVVSITLILLFVLFYVGRRLQNIITTLSVYLEMRGWSYWETDYRKYVSQRYINQKTVPYISQTKMHMAVFILLGVLCLVISIIPSLNTFSTWGQWTWISAVMTAIIFILYLILVLGLGRNQRFFSESDVRTKWKAAIPELDVQRTKAL